MPRLIGLAFVAGETLALEDIRAARRAAAEAHYQAARQSPMVWDFGETEALDDFGASVGPAGVQTLQMRDEPHLGKDDVKNWLGVGAGAITAMIGGAPTLLQPLKTTANVWVQTTAAQALAALVTGDGVQLSALQRGYAMLQAFGAVKRAIEDAEDETALAAVDVTAGYPG